MAHTNNPSDGDFPSDKEPNPRRRAPSPGLKRKSPKAMQQKRRKTAPAMAKRAVVFYDDEVVEPEALSVHRTAATSEESEALSALEKDLSHGMAKRKVRRFSHATGPGAVAVSRKSPPRRRRSSFASSDESEQSEDAQTDVSLVRRQTERHEIDDRISTSSSNMQSTLENRQYTSSLYGDSADSCFSEDPRRNSSPSRSSCSTPEDDFAADDDLEASEGIPLEPSFQGGDILLRNRPSQVSTEPFTTGFEAIIAPVQTLEQWRETQFTSEDKGRKHKYIFCCILVVVLVVTTLFVVGMVAILSGSNASDSSDTSAGSGDWEYQDMTPCFEADAAAGTFPSRYSTMREQLFASSTGEVSRLDEPNSPQRMALCWLAGFDDIKPPIEESSTGALVQRYAVAVLYFTLMDESIPSGLATSNWVTSDHECSWRGVSCTLESKLDSKKLVTRVVLTNEFLHGSLPAEVGDLSNLDMLMLSKNKLTGKLPSSLWDIPSLSVITLEANILRGTLSSEIAKLSNLRVLSLSENNLSGSIPEEIGMLTNLFDFILSGNFIEGTIPSTIGLCTKLSQFVLSDSRLKGTFPSEVGLLKNLQNLDVSTNSFSGIVPSEVGALSNLHIFDISDNALSGPIPEEFSMLSSLSELNMQGNFMEGTIPTSIGALSSLEHLVLAHNVITGTIPSEIGELLLLESFVLSDNELSGTLPSEIGRLLNLVTFIASDAGLSGTIPSTLGDLTTAEYIVLVDNKIVGAVPNEICNLRDGYLETLEVDCAGDVPQVECPVTCCTFCE